MFELLLTNADLVPMAGAPAGADAVAVAGGRVAAVGRSDALAAAVGPTTRRVDLGGRTLLPGFNDAHVHIWKVGRLAVDLVDLRGAASLSEVRQRLDGRASRLVAGEWLLGRGVNELLLAERRLPDRKQLDAWFGQRPVLVTRACAHVAVANSTALRLAGVDADTPDPPAGEIDRDAQGEPTGVLRETAISLVERQTPAPTDDDYRRWVAAGIDRQLKNGVTAATDPGVDDRLVEAYRAMDAGGELPGRYSVMRLAPEGVAVDPQGLHGPTQGEHLSIDTVKFFLDGGLSGATAAISRPYRHAETQGVLRMTADELLERASSYAARGYSVAAHAIGDVAIDAGLNAYERLPKAAATRRRLEHFGLPSEEAMRRAADLGVLVATQPQFLPELGPNFAAYLPRDFPIVPYPFRSMIDAGLTVAFSSDGPVVVDDSPLAGVRAAVLRNAAGAVIGAEERITTERAIAAYTVGGAITSGDAPRLGSIEVGKLADFVVLNRNPIATPIEDFDSVCVDATYVAGACVYER